MKKLHLRMSIAAAFISSALLVSGKAYAAPGPTLPVVGSPSSISAGVFLPNGGDAKDRGGSTQLSVDFRYTVPVPNPLDVPARTIVSLGVQTGAKSGNHSTIVPLTVGEMFGANGKSPAAAGNTYFGIGAGVYFMNQSGISSTARIGGYAHVGYNINAVTYVDAKYQVVTHGDGLNVNVGLRF